MGGLTPVQRKIMRKILNAPKYTVVSLFRLALDCDVDYSYAWYCIQLLEARGLITVIKPNGRDLQISALGQFRTNGHHNMGVVLRNYRNIERKTQGIPSMDDLQHLRDGLDQPMAADYPRPVLTKEEKEKYASAAKKINAIKDQYLRLIYVAKMIEENVRLLKEVNEHRAARGLAPLPTYDPEKR
jgi:hypothetical protein